jgi:uncharacterized membrane protein YcaP (DUF421 family)
MDVQDLLMTALRATIIYFFLLIVIRLLGKREVGSSSAFDFMVALMLGEVVDEAIYGDVSMWKGFTVIAVVALWHVINAWASYKSKTIDRLTGATPTVLVEDGKIRQDALAKERLNEDELWSELRLMSIDELKEVKTATLEPNGKVSVIKQEWAKTVQKGDLPKGDAKQSARQQAQPKPAGD